MTKTLELQISKSRNLIQGLHKHLEEGGKGIDKQQLILMEQDLQELTVASDECSRLRAELTPKVKKMNELLNKVKKSFVEHKLIIKNRHPQEHWVDYGLTDKR